MIIGLSYKARSGKDTFVNAIINKFSNIYNIEKHCFADFLKMEVCGKEKELCERFSIPLDLNPPMDDPFCNSIYGKQRALLQFYGTEFRRAQNENYWIEQLENYLKNNIKENVIIFTPDCRYLNEVEWIKNNKGITINIIRPNFISDLTEQQKLHKSENELNNYDKFDYEIENDSTIENFNEKAYNLFEKIMIENNNLEKYKK